MEIVVLKKRKEQPGRSLMEGSGGAAAAERAAGGGALGEFVGHGVGAPKKNRAAPRTGDAARREGAPLDRDALNAEWLLMPSAVSGTA